MGARSVEDLGDASLAYATSPFSIIDARWRGNAAGSGMGSPSARPVCYGR